MSQLRHLAAAEARGSWPILTLTVVIHSLRVLVTEAGLRWFERAGTFTVFDGLDWPLALLELLAYALSVSLVVHRDPLVGPRAFWLTRPIAPRTLLAAKLIVCGAALVLAPVLINAGRLIAYGSPASAVVAASVQLALSRAPWLVIFWLLAAATRSTIAFVIAVLGVLLLGFLSLAATIAFVSVGRGVRAFQDPHVPALPLHDYSASYVAVVALICGGLAVVAWQYRARRALVTAAAAAGLLVMFIFGPWGRVPVFAKAEAPLAPAWANAPDAVKVTMPDTTVGRAASINRTPDGRRFAFLDATFQVDRLPPGFSTVVVPLTSRLTFADGRRLDGRGGPTIDFNPDAELATIVRSGTAAPFGALVVSRPLPTAGAARVVLLSTSDDPKSLAGQTARLETTLEVRLYQHRVAGALRLTPGAAIRTRNGNLYEIVRVAPSHGEIRVLTRRTVFPSLKPALSSDFAIGFHDRARREWLHAPQWSRGTSNVPPGLMLALPDYAGALVAPWGAAWLATIEIAVSRPAAIDPEIWMRDVALVVFESTYAGRVERQLTQNGVYLASMEPR
jgi:hypothetical protein